MRPAHYFIKSKAARALLLITRGNKKAVEQARDLLIEFEKTLADLPETEDLVNDILYLILVEKTDSAIAHLRDLKDYVPALQVIGK